MPVAECTEKKERKKRVPPSAEDLAKRQKLTPPQLAKLWGLDVIKVVRWIKSGELRAINGATDIRRRPKFLIDKRDIEAFEQARVISGPAPRSPRRKRSAPGAKEYF